VAGTPCAFAGRCPRRGIRSSWTARAVVDPGGLDRGELSRIVLKRTSRVRPDPAFPRRLRPYRNARRPRGCGELYKRVSARQPARQKRGSPSTSLQGVHRSPLHRGRAELFHPAGRPPRDAGPVQLGNASSRPDGTATARCDLVEGANSFITPVSPHPLAGKGIRRHPRRVREQVRVISSSYTIIANLLLRERSFCVRTRRRYVPTSLGILEQRAGNEAEADPSGGHCEAEARRPSPRSSDGHQREINAHYAQFRFFQSRPGAVQQAAIPRAAPGTPARG